MPRITVIEPTIDVVSNLPIFQKNKRRVAAYARVSTDNDEQYTSYEAQVEYYTRYIKEKEEWEYVETYADTENDSYASAPAHEGRSRV